MGCTTACHPSFQRSGQTTLVDDGNDLKTLNMMGINSTSNTCGCCCNINCEGNTEKPSDKQLPFAPNGILWKKNTVIDIVKLDDHPQGTVLVVEKVKKQSVKTTTYTPEV